MIYVKFVARRKLLTIGKTGCKKSEGFKPSLSIEDGIFHPNSATKWLDRT
jgi:hypothetical protein